MTDQPATEIRTRPHPACLLCGSPGEPLHQGLTDRLFGAPGRWDFKRCSRADCGLIWLDPMPTEEDIGLAYRNYFTHDEDQKGWKWRLFYGGYRALNALPAWVSGLTAEKQRLASMCLADAPPGRLLDVGCGDGRFLHRMQQAGWTGEGVDFDARAIARARGKFGLTAHVGDLAGRRYPADQFDAVTMGHVIEHLHQPVTWLAECRRVLKPGGRLVVTTPNMASWGYRRFQAHAMHLDPPRHLHLFSPANLRTCAAQAGFPQIEVRTTAANAETFFTVSLAIELRGKHQMATTPPPEILRPLRAVLLQYQEHSRLRAYPELGEELVMICRK